MCCASSWVTGPTAPNAVIGRIDRPLTTAIVTAIAAQDRLPRHPPGGRLQSCSARAAARCTWRSSALTPGHSRPATVRPSTGPTIVEGNIEITAVRHWTKTVHLLVSSDATRHRHGARTPDAICGHRTSLAFRVAGRDMLGQTPPGPDGFALSEDDSRSPGEPGCGRPASAVPTHAPAYAIVDVAAPDAQGTPRRISDQPGRGPGDGPPQAFQAAGGARRLAVRHASRRRPSRTGTAKTRPLAPLGACGSSLGSIRVAAAAAPSAYPARLHHQHGGNENGSALRSPRPPALRRFREGPACRYSTFESRGQARWSR